MHRATPLALCAAFALLAGCGAKDARQPDANASMAKDVAGDDVEALPSDGLAAPEGATLDRESNMSEPNGAGSASGGNAM